jgi:hypothetical protein
MSDTNSQRGRNVVKRSVIGGQVSFDGPGIESKTKPEATAPPDQTATGDVEVEDHDEPAETQEEYDARRELEIEQHKLLDELGTELGLYNEEHWSTVNGDGSSDAYGIRDIHRDVFTALFRGPFHVDNDKMTDEEIEETENAVLTISSILGGAGTIGGQSSNQKTKMRGGRLSNISMMLNKSVDISRALRSGDKDRMINELTPFGYIRAGLTGSGTGESDRQLTTYVETPHAYFEGGFQNALNTILVPGVDKEQEKPLVETFTRSLGLGNIFNAASEYDKFAEDIKGRPWIKILEEDRYYTVRYDPVGETTYVEWKPTTDIRNILTSKGFSSAMREWSEDALAALGRKVPAWSRRVKKIKEKYGEESSSVKHYGYSRGGGLATHMGGKGFGTGYFSGYMPKKGSKTYRSGDIMHDYFINPISLGLLIRNLVHV